ncbi:gamma-glutamyltransferase [Larkinella punicea]|uniref:Glutathione hydrolase proenzyme n=1 Tax=Larkinella punicea TaxID=2315727 RepID=A0A368JKC7_9BACT|nr:gamma-glutamyltransferase [Larkinella punicea]RCR67506.1 gamma-glutamyltransferase [Larkinella punicea]
MKSTVLVVTLLLITTCVQAQFRYSGRSFASRSEVIARHGMAATSQPLATQVALDVLKKGGSAVDAAIAANALLGLVEPTGNGIGGDLFAIVWDAKTKKLYGFNGSGRSPKSLSLAYFEQQQMKQIPGSGALSVSVPGCVDGWYTLHERFGKLPMKDLLQPTVNYAREGYPVTEVIAFLWQGYARSLQRFPNYRQLYMPGGQAPQKGDIFKNEDLAATLEKIIKGGRDAFYKGDIARTIAATVKRDGGFLSYEDLATHRSNWVDPVSTNYRGYDVWELPPNGQGVAVLQMLNILEGYDLKKMGFGSPAHLHAMIEAKKLVFEDRAVYYADPDFYKAPTAQLISKPYAAERRKLIDSLRAGRNYKAGLLEGASNTIYLTTADQDGNMVSLIQSNYAGMGSGIVPDGLGFSLQNRGTSFTLEKGKPNTFEPGKRPFHTLIPAFITKDGQPYVSFGVMGADFQAQGHIQIITNLIDFGMNLQEAGDAPRFSHSGSSGPTGSKSQGGGQVSLENGFPAETVLQLMRMGHEVGYDLRGYGGYQGILYDPKNKVYYGASESRKDGHAAGY